MSTGSFQTPLGGSICSFVYFVLVQAFELIPAQSHLGFSLSECFPDLCFWSQIIEPVAVRAPDIGSYVSNHGPVTQP